MKAGVLYRSFRPPTPLPIWWNKKCDCITLGQCPQTLTTYEVSNGIGIKF